METQQCGRRVTVVGCQNGHVKVAVTDLTRGPSMIVVTLKYTKYMYDCRHREQKSRAKFTCMLNMVTQCLV